MKNLQNLKTRFRFSDLFRSDIIVLLVILLIAIFTRLIFAWMHFTHSDDLIAPYFLKIVHSYSQQEFDQKLAEYGFPNIISSLIEKIIGIDNKNYFLKFLLAPIAVAKSSSFAPLQFYLTQTFINSSGSYSSQIFFARLPSALFFIGYIIFSFKLIKEVLGIRTIYLTNLFLVLPVCSWMLSIYSGQSETYIIGFLFIPLWLILLRKCFNPSLSYFPHILLSLSLFAGTHSTYQLIFFLPGLVIAFSYQLIKSNKGLKYKIFSALSIYISAGLSFFVPYILFLKNFISSDNRGVGWNAGENLQYLFSYENYSPTKLIPEFLKFLYVNFNHIIYSVNGFNFIQINIFSCFSFAILIFSIIGLIILWRNPETTYISIFSIVNLLSWIYMVFTGVLPFSPTRHSILYMAIIWIISHYGLAYCLQKTCTPRFSKFIARAATASILFIYLFDLSTSFKDRINPLYSSNIFKNIEEYKPLNIIAVSGTLDLEFDGFVKQNYTSEWIQEDHAIIYTLTNSNESLSPALMLCNVSPSCMKDSNFSKAEDTYISQKDGISYKEKINHKSSEEIGFGNFTSNGSNYFRYRLYEYS